MNPKPSLFGQNVQHDENFPVASWLCPPRLRAPIRAIYRFARVADDLADEGDASASWRLTQLAAYRVALQAACSASPDPAPPSVPPAWAELFADLRRAVHEHALPSQPLHDLLTAFERDVPNPLYPDRAALLDYCRHSANPVGRLLLHLAGMHDAMSQQQSDQICSALQLINFWQDISVDWPRARIYVPVVDLDRHGLDAHQLPTHDTGATRALLRELVEWARSMMLAGAPLARRMPGRLGWEMRLVVQGGLLILDKLEASDFSSWAKRPKLRPADAPKLVWRAFTMRP